MLFHNYFVVVCRVVVCDLVRVLYRCTVYQVVAHTISSVTVLLVRCCYCLSECPPAHDKMVVGTPTLYLFFALFTDKSKPGSLKLLQSQEEVANFNRTTSVNWQSTRSTLEV